MRRSERSSVNSLPESNELVAMIHHPCCPVCSARDWRELGARSYTRTDAAGLSEYVRSRYRVLFEVWHPGLTEIRIVTILCESCGLIIQRPRPESSDLDAKYAFLNQLEPTGVREGANAVDRARGREIFKAVRRMSGRAIGGGAVLDYGGGDGRLMEPFRAVSCHCELVDYSPHPVPGVVKKGDTLRDLANDQRYDWIVASHVIEHVADPLGELRALRGHLLQDGILFVEVPFEIWGRPPLPEEPVTHINFFTRSSLQFALAVAGLEVLECRLAASLHPTNTRFASIQAVARRSRHAVKPVPPGTREAELFLSNDPIRKIRCVLQCPGVIAGALGRRMKQLWRNKTRREM